MALDCGRWLNQKSLSRARVYLQQLTTVSMTKQAWHKVHASGRIDRGKALRIMYVRTRTSRSCAYTRTTPLPLCMRTHTTRRRMTTRCPLCPLTLTSIRARNSTQAHVAHAQLPVPVGHHLGHRQPTGAFPCHIPCLFNQGLFLSPYNAFGHPMPRNPITSPLHCRPPFQSLLIRWPCDLDRHERSTPARQRWKGRKPCAWECRRGRGACLVVAFVVVGCC